MGTPAAAQHTIRSDDVNDLRYGAFAPQGWKLEYSGWGATDAWAHTISVAKLAEELGYHHLWVYDHVETVPRREPTHVFEAFTTLAALAAAHVERAARPDGDLCGVPQRGAAREGSGVRRRVLGRPARSSASARAGTSASTRRTASSSRRRVERLRILSETIQVVRRLWTEETVTLRRASTCTFDGAYCDPKPLQQLPEIWVGGGGEQVTLRIAARHADKTNWQVGLDDVPAQDARCSRRHCDEVGRDFDVDHAHARARLPIVRHRARLRRLAATRRMAGRLRAGGDPRRVRARPLRRHRRAGGREGAWATPTPGAASSCCGSATSRRPRASSDSLREVVPLVERG